MTEQKIPCEMIRDLMPLYMDGLTSGISGQEVEKHMEECGECRETFRRLQMNLKAQTAEKQSERKKEIDYLKRIRKTSRGKTAAGIAAVIVLFCLAAFLKLYVIGSPNSSYMVLYTNVYEDSFEISGMCYSSAATVARYKIEKKPDGSTELILYTCLPSFFNRSGSFQANIDFSKIGTGLNAGGVTIKPDGTVIGKMANDVYQARNPYVGDVPADGKLVQALGMMGTMGAATTELQTSSEPYRWTFHFTDSVKNSVRFEEMVKNYACVLIAMTDNLSEVGWTYTVELEEGAVERNSGITREECDVYVGSPVKAFAESPEKVQELLDILGF